ncbi:unnamed protein product [Owenia fusiformis]|uniref:Uncharacterized protein n=1 Tax=Owenia fusiformis TaxID=6347 RepID=A0A8S4N0C5_OWEFU|nr:unnamed protein product [Owenia fusiformis]
MSDQEEDRCIESTENGDNFNIRSVEHGEETDSPVILNTDGIFVSRSDNLTIENYATSSIVYNHSEHERNDRVMPFSNIERSLHTGVPSIYNMDSVGEITMNHCGTQTSDALNRQDDMEEIPSNDCDTQSSTSNNPSLTRQDSTEDLTFNHFDSETQFTAADIISLNRMDQMALSPDAERSLPRQHTDDVPTTSSIFYANSSHDTDSQSSNSIKTLSNIQEHESDWETASSNLSSLQDPPTSSNNAINPTASNLIIHEEDTRPSAQHAEDRCIPQCFLIDTHNSESDSDSTIDRTSDWEFLLTPAVTTHTDDTVSQSINYTQTNNDARTLPPIHQEVNLTEDGAQAQMNNTSNVQHAFLLPWPEGNNSTDRVVRWVENTMAESGTNFPQQTQPAGNSDLENRNREIWNIRNPPSVSALPGNGPLISSSENSSTTSVESWLADFINQTAQDTPAGQVRENIARPLITTQNEERRHIYSIDNRGFDDHDLPTYTDIVNNPTLYSVPKPPSYNDAMSGSFNLTPITLSVEEMVARWMTRDVTDRGTQSNPQPQEAESANQTDPPEVVVEPNCHESLIQNLNRNLQAHRERIYEWLTQSDNFNDNFQRSHGKDFLTTCKFATFIGWSFFFLQIAVIAEHVAMWNCFHGFIVTITIFPMWVFLGKVENLSTGKKRILSFKFASLLLHIFLLESLAIIAISAYGMYVDRYRGTHIYGKSCTNGFLDSDRDLMCENITLETNETTTHAYRLGLNQKQQFNLAFVVIAYIECFLISCALLNRYHHIKKHPAFEYPEPLKGFVGLGMWLAITPVNLVVLSIVALVFQPSLYMWCPGLWGSIAIIIPGILSHNIAVKKENGRTVDMFKQLLFFSWISLIACVAIIGIAAGGIHSDKELHVYGVPCDTFYIKYYHYTCEEVNLNITDNIGDDITHNDVTQSVDDIALCSTCTTTHNLEHSSDHHNQTEPHAYLKGWNYKQTINLMTLLLGILHLFMSGIVIDSGSKYLKTLLID